VATSFLWIAYSLPALLVGPIAAATVDMVSRRNLLMVSTVLQSLTILTYAFLHQSRIFLIYGVAFVYSLCNQFYVPAEAASVPSLVPKKSLSQANSLFFLTQQASLALGLGLASLFNTFIGFTPSLYLAGILPLLSFFSASFLPEMLPGSKLKSEAFEGGVGKFFAGISEGYQFIKSQRRVLTPFLLLGGLQVAATVAVVTFPAFAAEILKVSVNSAAIYIVIPAAIGAIAGALYSNKLLRERWRKKKLIELSLMLLTLSLFVLVFIVPELMINFRLVLGALSTSLLAFSFVGMIIPTQTFLQEVTPGGLRGRVFGNFWFLVTIATVFPVIFSGTITDIFGIRMLLMLFFGVGITLLVYSKKLGQRFLENGY
jgi:MFS family permease